MLIMGGYKYNQPYLIDLHWMKRKGMCQKLNFFVEEKILNRNTIHIKFLTHLLSFSLFGFVRTRINKKITALMANVCIWETFLNCITFIQDIPTINSIWSQYFSKPIYKDLPFNNTLLLRQNKHKIYTKLNIYKL